MAEIGSVLGGRYRLIELLGQGGMATIYRARDNQLERDVAVKVLRTEYGRDPDFLSRFRQEAQAAASLNHPNITAVFDYGQDPVGPFIVMELVDGEDLAKILRDNGPLPPRQAARLTAEVARALAAAHARGIVHRDVKPGNVMVARDGRVKVADFGIARAVAEAQMTLPGTTLGSVHYFSPEQARGETTTVASDVYSLGIVLYELLTGRRPWTGDSAASIAMARLSGDVPSPAAARGGIPADLDAITQRALAPDPAERFESAAAMAAALDDAVGSGGRQDASARLAGAGGVAAAGLGAAGAGGGTAAAGAAGASSGPPTIASGVARPNPSRIPYSPDAYADGTPAGEAAPPRPAPNRARRVERYEEPEEERGTSPWVWISALLALAILVAAGFLVFQLLSGSTPPPVEPVRVPGFIGLTLDQAEQRAEENDLEVVQAATEERTDVDEGTVVAQDPPEGREVDPGSTVRLTIARAPGSVAVPDLRNLTEPEAVARLQEAGLTFGGRTEEFDPIVEAGRIIRSDPGANLMVARGSPVTYIVSRGPEPTPSPTPEPTPTPTPEPTPTPTPAPTPPPTAPPTDPPTDPPTEEPG